MIKASRDGSCYRCVISDKYGNQATTREVYIYVPVPAKPANFVASTSDEAAVVEEDIIEETVDTVEVEAVEVVETIEEAAVETVVS